MKTNRKPMNVYRKTNEHIHKHNEINTKSMKSMKTRREHL